MLNHIFVEPLDLALIISHVSSRHVGKVKPPGGEVSELGAGCHVECISRGHMGRAAAMLGGEAGRGRHVGRGGQL